MKFGNDQIIKSNQLSLTLVKSFLSSQATKIWNWDFFCYVNKINETFPKLRSRNMKCSVTKPIDGKLVILRTVSAVIPIINGLYSTLLNGKWFSLEKSQKKLLESQKLWRNWPHFTTCARLATAFFPRNTQKSPFCEFFFLDRRRKKVGESLKLVIFVQYVLHVKSDSRNKIKLLYNANFFR